MLRSRFPRARKIAAALAAGCSVVARPACEAPGPCFAIAQALIDVGAPPGVITTITGPASKLAAYLIASPVIVHRDADPVAAARALAMAKFRNSGQLCISPSRICVHASLKEPFETTLAEVARSIVVGDGRKDGVTMGPMIRRKDYLEPKYIRQKLIPTK